MSISLSAYVVNCFRYTLQPLDFLGGETGISGNLLDREAVVFHPLSSLNESFVGCALFDDNFAFLPLIPIGVSEVAGNFVLPSAKSRMLVMASTMCSKRSRSLTFSLIYQFSVLVYTFSHPWSQCPILNNVDGAVENFLQFTNHRGMFQQTDAVLVVLHEQIDITQWRFLTTCERAKEPSPHNGLVLEIVGNLLIHLGTHKRFN